MILFSRHVETLLLELSCSIEDDVAIEVILRRVLQPFCRELPSLHLLLDNLSAKVHEVEWDAHALHVLLSEMVQKQLPIFVKRHLDCSSFLATIQGERNLTDPLLSRVKGAA